MGWRFYGGLILVGTFGVLGSASCLRPDPNHCANQGGDQACGGANGGFCSICVLADGGCVAEEPSASCYSPGSSDSVGSTTSATTDASEASTNAQTATTVATSLGDVSSETSATSAETTGPPVVCTEMGLDASCPALRPFCVDEECADCITQPASFCDSVDAATPTCHPESGSCTECVEDGDCAAVCGDAFTCIACDSHDDCPDSACDLEAGECMEVGSAVFWVDASGCGPVGAPASDPGFGTESDPYCWLDTALDNVAASESAVVHLRAGTGIIAQEFTLDNRFERKVALIGHDRPRLVDVSTAVSVGNSSTAFIEGIDIVEASEDGALCRPLSTLWLTDVAITSGVTGVRGNGCTLLTLERTLVAESVGDGVFVQDSGVVLRSSAIVRSGDGLSSTGLRADGSSTLDISYTTFAHNTGVAGGASIECSGTVQGTISDSVLVSAEFPSFACPSVAVSTSVLDTDPANGEDVTVVDTYDATWFERLSENDVSVRTPQSSPFKDVARWDLGDPLRELSGDRRLAYPERVEFAGADQP